ncbi:MAG: hypothetical protein ACKVX7_04070 [Planctomycetota bacterium]
MRSLPRKLIYTTATLAALCAASATTRCGAAELPFGAGQHRTYLGTLSIIPALTASSGEERLDYDVLLYALVFHEHDNGEPQAVLLRVALTPRAKAPTSESSQPPPRVAEDRYVFLELGADRRVTEGFGHWHLPAIEQLVVSPVPPKSETRTVMNFVSPCGSFPVTQEWTRTPSAEETKPLQIEGRGPRRAPATEASPPSKVGTEIVDLVERYSIVGRPEGALVQSYNLSYCCARSREAGGEVRVELSLELSGAGEIEENLRFQHRAELGTLRHFLKQVGPSANLDELAEICVMLRERLLGSPYRELGVDTLEELIEETRAARADLIAEQVRLEELLGKPLAGFTAQDLPVAKQSDQVTVLVLIDEKSVASAALLAALKAPLEGARERVCAIGLSRAPANDVALATWAKQNAGTVTIASGYASLFESHRLSRLPVVLILDAERVVRAIHVGFDAEAGPREIADKLQGVLDVTRGKK